MVWPQIAIVGWLVLSVGHALAHDGQPREGAHDAAATALCVILFGWILWMGGFFS